MTHPFVTPDGARLRLWPNSPGPCSTALQAWLMLCRMVKATMCSSSSLSGSNLFETLESIAAYVAATSGLELCEQHLSHKSQTAKKMMLDLWSRVRPQGQYLSAVRKRLGCSLLHVLAMLPRHAERRRYLLWVLRLFTRTVSNCRGPAYAKDGVADQRCWR